MNDNEKNNTLSPKQKFEAKLALYRGLSMMLKEKRQGWWRAFPEMQIIDLRDHAWLELVDLMPFDAVLDIEDLLADLNLTVQP